MFRFNCDNEKDIYGRKAKRLGANYHFTTDKFLDFL